MRDKAIDVVNKLHKDNILAIALKSLVACRECPLREISLNCSENCGSILMEILYKDNCDESIIDCINRSIDEYESCCN